ncbi:GltB/FmdC/FwdC-like GXGXG domain-containing protein [Methanopyrus sp.]
MKEKVIDCRGKEPRDINSALKTYAREYDRIVLKNPGAKHYIAAGLTEEVEVIIKGSVGYYVGTMIHGPRILVEGNAGWYPGDNVTKGEIVIEGHAGDGVGQGMYGGTVVVRGDAGSRVGQIMKNGTVIVGGDVEIMTGMYMMGGTIVVLGDAGTYTGESMLRGEIYVLGEVEELGKNAEIVDPDGEDIERVWELVRAYDFDVTRDDLKALTKVVPKSKRPFYGTEEMEEG